MKLNHTKSKEGEEETRRKFVDSDQRANCEVAKFSKFKKDLNSALHGNPTPPAAVSLPAS